MEKKQTIKESTLYTGFFANTTYSAEEIVMSAKNKKAIEFMLDLKRVRK
jgi:hypothetical protein